VVRFALNGWLRSDRKIDWFRDEYEVRVDRHRATLGVGDGRRDLSIIAHSFGTWMVANAMLKYDTIRVDRLILCGSILPADFQWDVLFDRKQLTLLKHEYGLRDIWARVSRHAVPGTGNSGAVGFSTTDPRMRQEEFRLFRHSDFFTRTHMLEKWLPVLQERITTLTIREGGDIASIDEWLAKRDMFTREIDQVAYGRLPGYGTVGPTEEQLASWFNVEPDIWTYVIDARSKRYVGYINALPIKCDRFEAIMSRGLPDRDFSPDHIASYRWDTEVCLCPLSIAVHPRWLAHEDQAVALLRLLGALFKKLEFLARDRGVRVLQVGAAGWTHQGRRLCKTLEMTEESKDEYGNPVFRLRIDRDAVYSRRWKFSPMARLMKTYRSEGERRSWAW
jgi:hypothetical protein